MEIDEVSWEMIKDYKRINIPKFKNKENIHTPNELEITPINIFNLIFTTEVFDIIVNETNKYTDLMKDKKKDFLSNHHKSRLLNWTPTNSKEMKLFLGLHLAMIIHSNSEITDNWSIDPLLSTIWSVHFKRSLFTFEKIP